MDVSVRWSSIPSSSGQECRQGGDDDDDDGGGGDDDSVLTTHWEFRGRRQPELGSGSSISLDKVAKRV